MVAVRNDNRGMISHEVAILLIYNAMVIIISTVKIFTVRGNEMAIWLSQTHIGEISFESNVMLNLTGGVMK